MTHNQLVDIAHKWALRKSGCGAAYKEVKTYATSEIPDVIAFGGWGRSVMIECKVSRADFRRDALKCHSKPMGRFRFYCVPVGLIGIDELPTGYGLIEVNDKGKVYFVFNPFDDYIGVPPAYAKDSGLRHKGHDVDYSVDRNFMYSILRRMA